MQLHWILVYNKAILQYIQETGENSSRVCIYVQWILDGVRVSLCIHHLNEYPFQQFYNQGVESLSYTPQKWSHTHRYLHFPRNFSGLIMGSKDKEFMTLLPLEMMAVFLWWACTCAHVHVHTYVCTHSHIYMRAHRLKYTCGLDSPLAAEVTAATWSRENSDLLADHVMRFLFFPNLLTRWRFNALNCHLQWLQLPS